MFAIDVCLEFPCAVCHKDVHAKLICSGSKIDLAPEANAGVNLCCPHCHVDNKVYFALSGEVLAVEQEQPSGVLQPSMN